MPIVEGKHYPYSAKGVKAATKAKKIHRTSAKSAASKLGF